MNAKYLVVAALVALVASPLSAQSVKAGIEAWQHADYATAVAIWRPLAESGDADAAFNLGQAYRLGAASRSTSPRRKAGSYVPPKPGTSMHRRHLDYCSSRTVTR